MTIRYDDELEPLLEQLKQHYNESTKNKVIVTVLENHMKLVESLRSANQSYSQMKQRYSTLSDLVNAKDDADKALLNFISANK